MTSILIDPFVFRALAGGMLLCAFFLVARMRLRAMLKMFACQSLLLAIFAGLTAFKADEPSLYITALLTAILKVWFIPWLLVFATDRARASHRLQAYIHPTIILMCAALTVGGAFMLTRSLLPVASADYLMAASAVSMILLGLLMLVTRKDMYGQIIGFLLMENGIFTFGLTLTGGMPLLVEMGIFFDVAIGAVLMAALSYRVQQELETVDTDTLTKLID